MEYKKQLSCHYQHTTLLNHAVEFLPTYKNVWLPQNAQLNLTEHKQQHSHQYEDTTPLNRTVDWSSEWQQVSNAHKSAARSSENYQPNRQMRISQPSGRLTNIGNISLITKLSTEKLYH